MRMRLRYVRKEFVCCEARRSSWNDEERSKKERENKIELEDLGGRGKNWKETGWEKARES